MSRKQKTMSNEKKTKIGVFDSGVGGKFIAGKLKALKDVKIIRTVCPDLAESIELFQSFKSRWRLGLKRL